MKKSNSWSFKIIDGGIAVSKGFSAGAVKAGIKASGGLDTALVVSAAPCSAAGTFTCNAVRASSVDFCESLLPSNSIRAVICTSGNANACTGKQGEKDTRTISALVSKACGLPAGSALVASTGVIGHPMPMQKVASGINAVSGLLNTSRAGADLFPAPS